jgi:serine/threonine protein kinase
MDDGEEHTIDIALKQMLLKSLKKDKFINYSPTGTAAEVTGLEKVYMEIYLMQKLSHPNIVKLYEIIEAPDHDYLYMILEFCHFGQIADWSNSEEKYTRNQKLVDHLIETEFKGKVFDSDIQKLETIGK